MNLNLTPHQKVIVALSIAVVVLVGTVLVMININSRNATRKQTACEQAADYQNHHPAVRKTDTVYDVFCQH